MNICRYLAPFQPKHVAHYFTDVLVVGGGLAGLRAANSVDPRLSVLVVTKDRLLQSNSTYAQGGIAGVLGPDDEFEHHVEDTLAAGGGLCDVEVTNMVVREGPKRIAELVDWGTRFDKQGGELVLGREGGHSRFRVVHALGDATGKEVMRAVIQWTRNQDNVQIWENAFTLDLFSHEGRCRGAMACSRDGGMRQIWAKETILCTGGAGQLYRESTNPSVATADGHAMAYRAGAELRDMEFVQFHPTVLYIAGSGRSLITEAIRGEGGRLVDRDNVRFMSQYDSREELAPRDVVAQAIVCQMDKTRHPCVFLDLSHLDPDFVKRRFPGIARSCAKFGLDITTDQIPVRPGAHYMIGGVTVDMQGQTTLPGLWAAGEVTSSGLHGANRLASNSLLEGLVFGAATGQGASQAAMDAPDDFHAIPLTNPKIPEPDESLDVADIRNSLQSLMWRSAAVRREQRDLSDALETVENWCQYVLRHQFSDPAGWELQNLLTVSQLVLTGCLRRQESRGVHLRTDFPNRDDDNWRRRIVHRRRSKGDNGLIG